MESNLDALISGMQLNMSQSVITHWNHVFSLVQQISQAPHFYVTSWIVNDRHSM